MDVFLQSYKYNPGAKPFEPGNYLPYQYHDGGGDRSRQDMGKTVSANFRNGQVGIAFDEKTCLKLNEVNFDSGCYFGCGLDELDGVGRKILFE